MRDKSLRNRNRRIEPGYEKGYIKTPISRYYRVGVNHCTEFPVGHEIAASARIPEAKDWRTCQHYEAREVSYKDNPPSIFCFTETISERGYFYGDTPFRGERKLPWKGQYKLKPQQHNDIRW